MRQRSQVITGLSLTVFAFALLASAASAQAGPPPDERVANRALRVAKDIAAPMASDSTRAAAYREALRILDSAEAAGTASGVTHFARSATMSYVVERELRAAREAESPAARCAAARRARALADTLRAHESLMLDHSPSERVQAVRRRWLALPDTAAAAVRAACLP
jgi:hypothetical protein